MHDELLPCPHCGGEASTPTNWGDPSRPIPRCKDCGAEALSPDAWNRRAPRLTWTTERPTVPGWYWARHPFIVDRVMVSVGQEHISRNEFKPGSQWAGPIPEPEPEPDTLA